MMAGSAGPAEQPTAGQTPEADAQPDLPVSEPADVPVPTPPAGVPVSAPTVESATDAAADAPAAEESTGRPAAPAPASRPATTGHPAVDAALAEVARLAGGPPAAQVPAFQAAHRVLRETLASIDEQ